MKRGNDSFNGILEETEEKTMEDTNLPAPSCDANDELNRKLRDNFDGKTPAVESEEIENRSGKNYGDLFQY